MKSTTAFFLTAAAALVRAQKPPSDDAPINCAKPNANYCMAPDIILRCDENGIGTAGRCSPNLSGYPPAGGIATCWESSDEAGDAACEKNCVVYAEPSFTLPSDECTPSHTETGHPPTPTQTHHNSTSITTVTSLTTVTNCVDDCTGTHPPPPPPTSDNTWPTVPPTTNGTWPPTETHPPPPPPGTTDGGEEPTNVPVPPTNTGPDTIPTGAAVANKAGTLLAAAGLAAVYLL